MSEWTFDQKVMAVKTRLSSFNQDLTEEQVDFVLHALQEPCYLKACPGSGKTEMVGLKAAFEIANWKDHFAGLAILSFTNNAANEISERIQKHSGKKSTSHPHFIGTIDSWMHGYILHPFAHKSSGYKGRENDKSFRIVDNELRYDFLNPYKTVISNAPSYKEAWVNEYYFECAEETRLQTQSRSLDITSLSNSVKSNLKSNKKTFLKAGFTTYADAEFLCYYVLKNNEKILNNIIKRFPIIIIDECQDLSNNQLEILKLLHFKGSIIHLVGDTNQSIYEFKKVYVEQINEFIKTNKLTERKLTRNFRSNQQIVNICIELEKINTSSGDTAVSTSIESVFPECCLVWQYDDSNFANLPQRFIEFVTEKNSLIKDENLRISLNRSAILARGRSTLSTLQTQTTSNLSKVELFASALKFWNIAPQSGKRMQDALTQLGKSLSLFFYQGAGNHGRQSCPESYTSTDWRFFLLKTIKNASKTAANLFPFENLTWSIWAANLKSFLESHYSEMLFPSSSWDDVKNTIKAPSGSASKLVSERFKMTRMFEENIRMTTFHDVKGETLDAVLMISSKNKKSKGGHFEHWLSAKPDEKEFVRFAYVGSSRPKHLLIWAIPKPKVNYGLGTITQLGFKAD